MKRPPESPQQDSDDRTRSMFCLKCRYDLRDSTNDQCVECGRPFDPRDDSTYRWKARGPEFRPGTLSRLDWAAMGCFSIFYLMLASMPLVWVVAWIELGRQPSYNNPDPKGLTTPFTMAANSVFETLGYMVPASLVLCMGLLLVQMVRAFTRHDRVKPFVLTLFSCILLFIGAFMLLHVVAGTKAGTWLLD